MTSSSKQTAAYLLALVPIQIAVVLLLSISGCSLGHLLRPYQASLLAAACASVWESDPSSRMHRLYLLIQPVVPLTSPALQFILCCYAVL
jgi:hypothetical protein